MASVLALRGRTSPWPAAPPLGALGGRCLLRRPAIVDIPGVEMRLYLAPQWKGCWKAIFVFRERFFEVAEPELEFAMRSLEPGDTFVDAGAFHGWYSLAASRAVGEHGRVISCEPNPEAFAVLSRNIALNARMNIRAFNVALSNVSGRASLYSEPGDGLASSLGRVQGWAVRTEVTVRRLDDVLEGMGVDRVDLLKIDVEGAEALVLEGAVNTLLRSRPAIILEINPRATTSVGVPVRRAADILVGLGYRLYSVSAGALVSVKELPRVDDGSVFNLVAVCGHAKARCLTVEPWLPPVVSS
jgi:FkbM family methyltransferase